MAVISGEAVAPSVGTQGGPIITVFGGHTVASGQAESAIVYRMRAYDSTLGMVVYWNSPAIDDSGASYLGPGPLTMIVVSSIIPHA